MKYLTGVVTKKNGDATYGATVFISDNKAKELYSKKYRAKTDPDGKFRILLPPELIKTNRRLQVYDPQTLNKVSLPIKDGKTNYIFERSDDKDTGFGVADIEEVTISAKRPKKKKNYKPYIIAGSILLALILGYVVYKEFNKTKS
jgi:hypothetical protein